MRVRPVILSLCTPLAAQAPMVAAMDAYLQSIFKSDAPGAAVLVLKDGQPVLRRAYGLASLELGAPMRPDSVFQVASVGKQFTAAAILRLAEQGKLELKAPVARYLPEVPASWSALTVEHLLTHTSGIDNFWNDPALRARRTEAFTPQQLLALAMAKPLLYPPGTGFTYASLNYTFLALILERVTGQPYAAHLQSQFFQPLGMTHTTWDQTPKVIPGRVQPYNPGPRPAEVNHPSIGFGGGSFFSTTEDLARWTLALQGGKVLSPASLKAMDTPFRLADGRNTHYGYGIRPHGTPEDPYLQSNGDESGFHAEVVWQPRRGIFVAILHNGEDLDTGLDPIAKRVAAFAAGAPLTEPRPVALTHAELDRLCGRYALGPRVRTIRLEQGQLVSAFPGAPPDPIHPVSATECYFASEPDLRLKFELKDGRMVRVQVCRVDREPGPTYERMP